MDPFGKGIRTLNLSDTLIASWETVAEISAGLPVLEHLALKYALLPYVHPLWISHLDSFSQPKSIRALSPSLLISFSICQPKGAPVKRNTDKLGRNAGDYRVHAETRECRAGL